MQDQTIMDKAINSQDIAIGISNGDITLMKIGQVSKFLGISISGVYLKIANGTFPQPLKLSPKVSRWKSTDVAAWLNVQERRVGNAHTAAAQAKSVAASKTKRANAQAQGSAQ
jgi:prophage regulatory protein